MRYIEAWSDLIYQIFGILKPSLSFSSYRDTVILEICKVNFHDKRSLLVMPFFIFTDFRKNLLVVFKT